MKKNKLKKILGCAMVALIPLIVLTGCDSTVYTKTATNKTSTSFLSAVSGDIKKFAKNVNTDINNAIPLGDASSFDVSTLDDDAHNKLNSKILDFAQKANTEGLFATAIYQIATAGEQQNFFDLSFLANENSTQTQKNQLEQFFVQMVSKTQRKIVYNHKFVGEEYTCLNLVPVASKGTDNIDDVIKNWGNGLRFEAEIDGLGEKIITVNPMFYVPSEDEVKLSLSGKGECSEYKKINGIDNDTTSITVNYTDGSNTLTKKVEFVVSKTNGDVKKEVTLGSNYTYSYSLKVANEDELNLLGEYSILYDKMNSSISCTAKHSNTNEQAFEYIKTQTGELIARLFNKEANYRSVINIIINKDLQTGLIKYDYRRGSVYNELLKEPTLSKELCTITEEERTYATSNKNVEILNYTIGNNGVFVDKANVVKE